MNEGMLSIDIKNTKQAWVYLLWELVPDFNV